MWSTEPHRDMYLVAQCAVEVPITDAEGVGNRLLDLAWLCLPSTQPNCRNSCPSVQLEAGCRSHREMGDVVGSTGILLASHRYVRG
jgi:hypothetical protein